MNSLHALYFLILVTVFWSSQIEGLQWLSLATSGTVPLYHHDDCTQLQGMTRKQVRICRRNLKAMDSVRVAADISMSECQHQFQERRWNCNFIEPKSVFASLGMQSTRETAFIHALSSAAVAHSVTNACSQGRLADCGCDPSVTGASGEGFQWAGCSDNIVYGVAFSEKFVDARERLKGRHLVRGLVNVHNNNAGRAAVSSHMTTHCKCHGVSGSCELKTCWRAMPSFRTVGAVLKNKFDQAARVVQIRQAEKLELTQVNVESPQYTDQDLIYLSPSPDYCEADPDMGSLGTKGRMCSRDSTGIDGCGLLCCGRGYFTMQRTVIDTCQCKFHWCCEVKCQKCERVIEEHFCR